jgi:hypothetical protein
MKLYSITAQVVRVTTGWNGVSSRQVPAFLLSDRQAQDEAEAERLARFIVDPLGLAHEVHVTAVELEVA